MVLWRLWGAILLVSMLAATVCKAAVVGPEVGQPSPNIIGRTLDDKSYRLKSDIGSPKVINFFSVTCKPCQQEMPELAKLEKQYTGIKFISVHTKEEQPEIVAKFINSLSGAPSTVLLTSGGIQEAFHYLGLPHTIVLDSDNVVMLNLSGFTTDNIRLLNKTLKHLAK